MNPLDDTICAISTPIGEGGIGIARISGKEAIPIVSRLFRGKGKQPLSELPSHTIHYGEIIDPKTGERVDEVLLTIMKAPRTYTREDIVEINCHGGIVPLRRVLELILREGARLAEPGEYTKRAFLRGRIDLAQAEAVLDVIRSKTDDSLEIALDQLKGNLSKEINRIMEELLSLAALIETSIDFPEEDIKTLSPEEIGERIRLIIKEIQGLIETAEEGKIYREGIGTAIVGRPNVGKSSLLNALLSEDRAIVTPVPGTTRDIIEEWLNLKGVPLRIIDTAGIRHSIDPVEKEGVKRSQEAIERAGLVLLILDSSEELKEEDRDLIKRVGDKKKIIILNKIDLEKRIDDTWVRKTFPYESILDISAKEETGLGDLKEAIVGLILRGGITPGDRPCITRARHKDALIRASDSLGNLLNSLRDGLSPEFLSLDLRAAIDAVGEITGQTTTENILDRIFKDFCIGK